VILEIKQIENRVTLHRWGVAALTGMAIVAAARQASAAGGEAERDGSDCLLVITAPKNAAIEIDGRDFGTHRKLTYRGLKPGKRYFSALRVRFPDGGEAQRLISIEGGTTVRRSVMAPSRFVFAFTLPGRQSDICSVRFDGRGFRQLTHSDEEEGAPRLSPDGAKIAFARRNDDRKKTSTIHVMNVDGGAETMLAEGSWPRWSPDGTKILFSKWADAPLRLDEKDRPRSFEDVYVMNADGSGVRRLTDGRSARWSPDSKKIAFTRGGALTKSPMIYVIDIDGGADGGGPRELTRGGEPAWSPDGLQIAFRRKTFKTDRETIDEIYLMDADGGNVRHLTSGRNAVWSPKGRHIAFTEFEDVFIINRDGSDRRRLTQFEPHADGWISGICWSPDGKEIAFAHEYGVDRFVDFPSSFYSVYRVHSSGADLRRVVNRTGWAWAPDWR
jgi:Tol biopolymer transport system component